MVQNNNSVIYIRNRNNENYDYNYDNNDIDNDNDNNILPMESTSTTTMTSTSTTTDEYHKDDTNSLFSRLLAEAPSDRSISLVAGSRGQCQLKDSISAYDSTNGSGSAAGVYFTITARQALQILSFEFDDFDADETFQVEIYTRPGSDYLSVTNQKNQWTLVGETPAAIKDIEGLGAIIPRADMIRSSASALSMASGETRSFYITLLNTDKPTILVDNSKGTTGTTYAFDNLVQLQVGVSTKKTTPFETTSAQVEQNRAFQGKIHYRAIESCTNFGTSTEIVIPFVVGSEVSTQDINGLLNDGITQLLQEISPILKIWTASHGLSLQRSQSTEQGTRDDCTEFGFEADCMNYNGVFLFRHYEALTSNELTFEVTSQFEGMGSVAFPDKYNDKLFYAGPPVLQRGYDINLRGFPESTFLNPIQRSYIERVTIDFLVEQVDLGTYQVDITGQNIRRQRQRQLLLLQDYRQQQQHEHEQQRFLRRGKKGEEGVALEEYRDDYHSIRNLQSSGVVSVGVIISGISDDSKGYFGSIEDAFARQSTDYLERLVKEQYRPSEINDGTQNFGQIFTGLIGVSVARSFTNDTTTDDDVPLDESKGMTKNQIQILIFSLILGLSFLFLTFRIVKDCWCVEDGHGFKVKKLKRNEAKQEALNEAARKEAEAKREEEAKQEAARIEEAKKEQAKKDAAEKKEKAKKDKAAKAKAKKAKAKLEKAQKESERKKAEEEKKKEEEEKRKAEREKALQNMDLFPRVNPKPEQAKPAESGRGRSVSPSRGVNKSNTFAGAAGFFGSTTPSAQAIKQAQNGGANTTRVPSKSSEHSRQENNNNNNSARREPQRGVNQSKTFNGQAGFFGNSSGDAPPSRPEPQRGVRAAKSGDLAAMTRGRPEPQRGIGASKSGDLSAMARGRPEPQRGIGASKSGDLSAMARGRPEPQRGIGASRSGDLSAMVRGRPEPQRGIGASKSGDLAAMARGRPEPQRGIGASKSGDLAAMARGRPEPQRGVGATRSGDLSAMARGRPEPQRGVGATRSGDLSAMARGRPEPQRGVKPSASGDLTAMARGPQDRSNGNPTARPPPWAEGRPNSNSNRDPMRGVGRSTTMPAQPGSGTQPPPPPPPPQRPGPPNQSRSGPPSQHSVGLPPRPGSDSPATSTKSKTKKPKSDKKKKRSKRDIENDSSRSSRTGEQSNRSTRTASSKGSSNSGMSSDSPRSSTHSRNNGTPPSSSGKRPKSQKKNKDGTPKSPKRQTSDQNRPPPSRKPSDGNGGNGSQHGSESLALVPASPKQYRPGENNKNRPPPPPTRVDMIGPIA